MVAALLTVAQLGDDRPSRVSSPKLRAAGEPAAFPSDPRRSRARMGIVVRDRDAVRPPADPGFLISIGAGQVIPFLNLYIQRKFGLDLTALNAVFALTSLGTVLAILAQPRLARRFGQITSVVIVQGASIPFLVVLGFSPVLWTVISGDGGPELVDECRQPHLQRLLDGAGEPRRASHVVGRDERALAGRLGGRRDLVRVPPGDPGVRRGLHRRASSRSSRSTRPRPCCTGSGSARPTAGCWCSGTGGLSGARADMPAHANGWLVEMGESRTPRPGPFAGDHYERVRWFVVDRPDGHRHSAGRSSHVPLDRA